MAATFNVNVVLRPRGVTQGIANLHRGLNSLGATADAVGGKLAKAFYGADLVDRMARLVGTLTDTSDAYTTIANKVGAVTTSMDEQAAVMERLWEVSNKMRTPIEATATSYQRLRNATAAMGLSQNQTLRITETLGKGLKVYGSTTAEAASTMIQFTQALNSGKLNGDEFRAVMENSPAVVKLLTKELKVSKGELAAMSKAGKIGSKDMVNALLHGAKEIDAKFTKLIPTIGESFIVLRNNFIKSIGEMAAGSGIARAISAAMIFLAKHLDTVLKIVTSIGNGLSVVFAGRVMSMVLAGLRALGAALLANPFTALIVALVAIGSLLYKFNVGITSVGTGTVRFQKVVEVAWGKIKVAIGSAVSALGDMLKDAFVFFEEGFKDMEIGFGDILVFVGIFVDKFVQLIEFLAQTVVAAFVAMTAGILSVIVDGFGYILGALETAINAIIKTYNKVASKIPGVGSHLTLPTANLGAKALHDFSDDLDDAVKAAVLAAKDSFDTLTSSTYVGPVEKFMRDLLADSVEGAGKAKKGVVDLDAAGKKTFVGLKAGADKSADAFSKLIDTLYPATKALNDLRDAKAIVDKELAKGPTKNALSLEDGRRNIEELNRQYASGIITASQFADEVQKIADLMKRVPQSRVTDDEGLKILDRQRYVMLETADAIEHYGYMSGQAQQQAAILTAYQDQLPEKFEAERAARAKVNELIEKGIILSDFELDARVQRGQSVAAETAWRDQQIATIERYAATLESANAIEAEAAERNKRLTERIKEGIDPWGEYLKLAQEIESQFQEGSLSMDAMTIAAENLREEFSKKLSDDFIKDHNREVEKLSDDLEKLLSPMSLVNIGLEALGQQFKNFVMEGKASFDDLVHSLLGSLTDIILKIIETRIMLALLGPAIDPINAAAARNGGAGALAGLAGGLFGFARGGSFTVGGRGGVDSNLVAFKATRGERVTVQTPQQQADTDSQSSPKAPPVSLYVFNQQDPGQMVPVMGSRAGRRQVWNNLRYTPRAVEKLK